MTEQYGQLTGIEDTEILSEDDLIAQQTPDVTIDREGTVLWEYQNEGRINGVPVLDSDRGLAISRDDYVQTAFVLDRRPLSIVMWMSPEDTESQEKYDKLLQDVYDGRAEIVDETRQFDPSKGKFLVWIRYNTLCYRLHRRFEYLREELDK